MRITTIQISNLELMKRIHLPKLAIPIPFGWITITKLPTSTTDIMTIARLLTCLEVFQIPNFQMVLTTSELFCLELKQLTNG